MVLTREIDRASEAEALNPESHCHRHRHRRGSSVHGRASVRHCRPIGRSLAVGADAAVVRVIAVCSGAGRSRLCVPGSWVTAFGFGGARRATHSDTTTVDTARHRDDREVSAQSVRGDEQPALDNVRPADDPPDDQLHRAADARAARRVRRHRVRADPRAEGHAAGGLLSGVHPHPARGVVAHPAVRRQSDLVHPERGHLPGAARLPVGDARWRARGPGVLLHRGGRLPEPALSRDLGAQADVDRGRGAGAPGAAAPNHVGRRARVGVHCRPRCPLDCRALRMAAGPYRVRERLRCPGCGLAAFRCGRAAGRCCGRCTTCKEQRQWQRVQLESVLSTERAGLSIQSLCLEQHGL